MTEGTWRVAAAGLPLVAIHGALLWVFDLSSRLAISLALLAAGFAALFLAARRLERSTSSVVFGVLLVAALLRALLLPLPPSLSDDLLRYVWDGRVAAAGFNPYHLAPEAEALAPLRDGLWEQMPHKDVPTVYPPLAIGLFSIAAHLPKPLIALKALLATADFTTCALLLILAERLGVPLARTVWYAWNPLVTLEVAGMGHIDALGVTMVAATLVALTSRRRQGWAPLTATAGVLAKLVPAAALPMWSRLSGRPWVFLLSTVALLAAVGVPILVATGGVPPGLLTYGVSWEFNGPIYEPLWHLLERLNVHDLLARGLDTFKQATRQWERWNWIYPYLYPQFLAKLLLAGLAVAVVAISLAEKSPLPATGRLFGKLLLLSATFYPWYLLWVLPWAALARHPAWLALSALILISYVPQHTTLALFPWVFLLIWLPFWGLLAFGRRWSTV